MKIRIKNLPDQDSSLVYPIGILGDNGVFLKQLLESSYGSREIQRVTSPYTEKSFQYLSDDVTQEFLTWSFPELSNNGTDNASSSKIVPTTNQSFREKNKKQFLSIIQNTRFHAGEDNQATEMMSHLMEVEHDETLILLNAFFVEYYDDERLCVKILTMLNDYSFSELKPFGQTIALASISNKSSRVKSAAFNLFAHWACPEALKLIQQVEEPQQPWIAMKYYAVKKSLEKRCSTQEK